MISTVREAVQRRDSLDWILLASVAALAFNTHGQMISLMLFLGVLAVGYLQPVVLRLWWVWIGIALIQGSMQILRWEGIDDHVIVGTYWALAIGLGLANGDPARVMRISARWMIGFIFVLAVTWKLAVPEFRNGDFFSLYLLADPRFSLIADVVGGIDQATFEANRTLIGQLYSSDFESTQVTLQFGQPLRILGRVMTVWGIFIEAVMAISWLSPLPSRTQWIRHAALLVFCVTTYGLVAITGFGAILLVMAMASVEPTSVWRRVHAVGLVALVLWTPLWRMLLL